jgi:hypothetical protein
MNDFMIFNFSLIKIFFDTTESHLRVISTILSTVIERDNISINYTLFHNVIEHWVESISSHFWESKADNTIKVGIDKYLTHFLLDFSKVLVRDFNFIDEERVLVDFSAEDTCSELNFKIISKLVESLVFRTIILVMRSASWITTLFRINPDVSTTSIKNNIECVTSVTNTN